MHKICHVIKIKLYSYRYKNFTYKNLFIKTHLKNGENYTIEVSFLFYPDISIGCRDV